MCHRYQQGLQRQNLFPLFFEKVVNVFLAIGTIRKKVTQVLSEMTKMPFIPSQIMVVPEVPSDIRDALGTRPSRLHIAIKCTATASGKQGKQELKREVWP